MGKKKQILTEDLFNSNGNTEVSETILNESKKSNDKVKEEKSVKSNLEDTTCVIEEKQEDIVEEIQEESKDVIEDNLNTIDEVKEDKIEETKNDSKIIKSVLNNKIGFNDESYYYNDLK